jgi:SAM-dependent methyltransferase
MTSEGPLVHLREHPEIVDADLSLLARHRPSAVRVLDIGAGRGSFVLQARGRGLEAWGLEMQPEAAVVWRDRGVPGALGDGFRAPFADGAFDIVRMKEVLEHVQDPLALVLEAKRLLRKGGILLIHVPTPYSQLYPVGNFWDDYTHVRPFSRLGLRRLFEDAGMRLVALDTYTAGRNAAERLLGKLLAYVIPHIYRAVAAVEDD